MWAHPQQSPGAASGELSGSCGVSAKLVGRKGKCFDQLPDELQILSRCDPRDEEMLGLQVSTAGITGYDQLADRARAYLEEHSPGNELPIAIISTGSGRGQTVILRDLFECAS